MPKIVTLVACVSKKRDSPQPASQLYCSDWFVKAADYAAKHSDCWYILSAKYGLVTPDAIIEPYSETLKRMPRMKRRQWADAIVNHLKNILQPGDQVILLAGWSYREFLIEPIREMGCVIQVPMAGLGIGQQLHWLKSQR